MQTGAATPENSMEGPQKFNNRTTLQSNPVIALLGFYPRNTKTRIQNNISKKKKKERKKERKGISTPMFTAVFVLAKLW